VWTGISKRIPVYTALRPRRQPSFLSGCLFHSDVIFFAALGGLVVSVLATGLAAADSGPAEGGGFLCVIKIRSAHFLRQVQFNTFHYCLK
jgi:hypothetical protein